MFAEVMQEHVIARAMKDAAFRQALLGNPRAVLQEYGFYLPEHVSIRVLEEPPHTFTLVLPAREEAPLELPDAELEGVSGGLYTSPSNTTMGLGLAKCHQV